MLIEFYDDRNKKLITILRSNAVDSSILSIKRFVIDDEIYIADSNECVLKTVRAIPDTVSVTCIRIFLRKIGG